MIKHLDILVCPDCRTDLKKIEYNNVLIGFACTQCKMIFPVKDGIIILLAKKIRYYTLEYPLIQEIKQILTRTSNKEFLNYIENTLELIISKRNLDSWEWEDEKYWSKEYSMELRSKIPKKWDDRIWQREILIKALRYNTRLTGKNILDIGCGEGQTFNILLSKYCDDKSLYIATDISIEGLKLNQLKNIHKNSLYILCSEDYALPIRCNSIDILCYFGILHLTKNKIDNIIEDKTLLRENGCIILVESVDRPTLPLFWLKPMYNKSIHEEYINKVYLFSKLKEFIQIFIKEEGSPFYTLMINNFGNLILKNKKIFLLIMNLDSFLIRTVGRVLPYFRAGEILLLVKKNT